MAWKEQAAAVPEMTPIEVLLKRESFWTSGYNESDRWIKDMADCRYTLIGENDVDEYSILYRFEFNEDFRDEYPSASHFQNVLISRAIPPAKLAAVAEVKTCATCGK